MSHLATNWAIEQRGLKPATKVVLWYLADCHNRSTHRCDPRQDTIAAQCEMSRSTVNSHLDILASRGLIRRHKRFDPNTRKQLSTFYELAIDVGKPESENRTRDDEPVSGNGLKPCPENDEFRVRNPYTNPVSKPEKNPRPRAAPPERQTARAGTMLRMAQAPVLASATRRSSLRRRSVPGSSFPTAPYRQAWRGKCSPANWSRRTNSARAGSSGNGPYAERWVGVGQNSGR